MNKFVHIPHLGHPVVLVPRELMRRPASARRMMFVGTGAGDPLPAAPAIVDWSKGNSLSFPIDGNDKYGDCYYAAMCHAVQAMTGCVGAEAVFDVNAVINRYLKVSGGDNGLSDGQVYPEWKAGIVGPNGPHKILDDLTISPTDDVGIRLAMYLFGPVLFTAALPDAWIANPKPGDTWTAGRPDQNNGHAMALTGVNAAGNYQDQTWGFNPPIQLTPAGLKSADPEIITVFSLDWFNAQGYAPNGYHYTQLAAWWQALGGKALPPSPFPAPTPGPTPPTPTPGATYMVLTGTLGSLDAFDASVAKAQAAGWLVQGGPSLSGLTIAQAVVRMPVTGLGPVCEFGWSDHEETTPSPGTIADVRTLITQALAILTPLVATYPKLRYVLLVLQTVLVLLPAS